MSLSLEELKRTAATLSLEQRLELAHYLLDTLGPTSEAVRQEWLELAQNRLAQIEAGEVTARPVEALMERLRQKYG